MENLISPAPLYPGDEVIVVSPSRSLAASEMTAFTQTVSDWGFNLLMGEYVYAQYYQQAGTDEQRLEDLQWALDHPTAKAIFASRGGYGLTRIVDKLDWSGFKQNPKWLIGFSDFTALLSAATVNGYQSIHGLVPRQFGLQDSEQARATIYAALRGWPLNYEWRTSQPIDFETTGQLVGGNLAMLADGCGTAQAITAAKKILFLEDVGEPHYRIDRMLNQLRRNGYFQHVNAVILGQFTELTDLETGFGRSIYEMVSEVTAALVIDNFPSGHVADNRALIFGKRVQLISNGHNASLNFESAIG